MSDVGNTTETRRTKARQDYRDAMQLADTEYGHAKIDARERMNTARLVRTKARRLARKILLREEKIADMIDENEKAKSGGTAE